MFYGITYKSKDEMPPMAPFRRLLEHRGKDVADVEEDELVDLFDEERDFRDLGAVLDELLGVPAWSAGTYKAREVVRERRQMEEFGARIEFSYVGDLEYDNTNDVIAYVKVDGKKGRPYHQPDWTDTVDVVEVIKEAVLYSGVHGGVESWERALLKLGDFLPGATKPGWYVGAQCG